MSGQYFAIIEQCNYKVTLSVAEYFTTTTLVFSGHSFNRIFVFISIWNRIAQRIA